MLRGGKPEIFLQTDFNERTPAFSPDGRWIAYSSDETGVLEVYVREFSENAGKIQVSDGGGNYPVWSKGNHQLFMTNGDLSNQVMAVMYELRATGIEFARAHIWSNAKLPFSPPSRNYDVARDGTSMARYVEIDRGALKLNSAVAGGDAAAIIVLARHSVFSTTYVN